MPVGRSIQWMGDRCSEFADTLFGFDFFISYAHADGARYALSVAESLKGRGYRVFLDVHEYAPGEELERATLRRVRMSKVLIVLCRANAMNSRWVMEECRVCVERGRHLVVVDFDGEYQRLPGDHRFRALCDDRLRVCEPVGGDHDRPSADVLSRLSHAFTFVRVDTYRRVALSVIMVALSLATVTALWQGHVARSETTAANRERAEAVMARQQAVVARDVATAAEARQRRARESETAAKIEAQNSAAVAAQAAKEARAAELVAEEAALAARRQGAAATRAGARLARQTREVLILLGLQSMARDHADDAAGQFVRAAAAVPPEYAVPFAEIPRPEDRLFADGLRVRWAMRDVQAPGVRLRDQGEILTPPTSLTAPLYVGSGDRLREWDLSTSTLIRERVVTRDDAGDRLAGVSPDGKTVVWSRGKRVVVQGVDGSDPMEIPEQGLEMLTAARFSPDGRYLALCRSRLALEGKDDEGFGGALARAVTWPLFATGTLKLVDVADRKVVLDVADLHGAGGVPHWSADGRTLLVGCVSAVRKDAMLLGGGWVTIQQGSEAGVRLGSLTLWDARSPGTVVGPIRVETALAGTAFAGNGDRVVALFDPGAVQIWEVERSGDGPATGMRLRQSKAWAAPPVAAALSHDGHTAAVCDEQGVSIIDLSTGEWEAREILRGAPIAGAAFNEDGTLLATYAGSRARLWDTASGRPRSGWICSADEIAGVWFASRATLVTRDKAGNVRVDEQRDERHGAERVDAPGLDDSECVPSETGRFILVRPVSHSLRVIPAEGAGKYRFSVIDCRTRTLVSAEAEGTEDAVKASFFAGESRLMLSCEGWAGVWDCASGERLHFWRFPQERGGAQPGPGGRTIATWDRADFAVWDARSFTRLGGGSLDEASHVIEDISFDDEERHALIKSQPPGWRFGDESKWSAWDIEGAHLVFEGLERWQGAPFLFLAEDRGGVIDLRRHQKIPTNLERPLAWIPQMDALVTADRTHLIFHTVGQDARRIEASVIKDEVFLDFDRPRAVVSADGAVVAVWRGKGIMSLTKDGAQRPFFQDEVVRNALLSRDGAILAVAGEHRFACFDTRSGVQLAQAALSTQSSGALLALSDDGMLAAALAGGMCRLLDLKRGEERRAPPTVPDRCDEIRLVSSPASIPPVLAFKLRDRDANRDRWTAWDPLFDRFLDPGDMVSRSTVSLVKGRLVFDGGSPASQTPAARASRAIARLGHGSLFAALTDSGFEVWDEATGEVVLPLVDLGMSPSGVALSGSEGLFVAVGNNSVWFLEIPLWNVSAGELPRVVADLTGRPPDPGSPSQLEGNSP